MGKTKTIYVTIRWRYLDSWFGAECPDCGASILDRTISRVKNGVKRHGKEHDWKRIEFYEQV